MARRQAVQVIVGHLAVDQHKTHACSCRVSVAKPNFEALSARLNMDSPKNSRPIASPYRPPTSSPLSQTSTESRVTPRVQLLVGALDAFGDPGAICIGARRGAGLDDRSEVLVEGHAIALLAQ